MKRCDLLAFKIESSDTEGFLEDAVAYSDNSVLLVYGFDRITVRHLPPELRGRERSYAFFKTASPRLNYYLSPLTFVVNIALFAWVLTNFCVRLRPRACWMENTFAAVIAGFLRRCGFCQKAIHIPGDWLVNDSYKGLFSRIANNFIFPAADYLACRLCDSVLDHSYKITQARLEFWKYPVPRQVGLYEYRPRVKVADTDRLLSAHVRTMAFVGQIRPDSGLNIVLDALRRLWKHHNIRLTVVGPATHEYARFREAVRTMGLEEAVTFAGFLDIHDLPEVLSGCFCGINLLTSASSYSSFTMPGKMMHYIQNLLPMIVSPGIGAFAEVVAERKIGRVIDPGCEAFESAVEDIFGNQEDYRRRILDYVGSIRGTQIAEVVAPT